MNEHAAIIGVDIGGSHITAARVDAVRKTVIEESVIRENVDSYAKAEEIIDIWSRCIAKAMSSDNTSKLCLAVPGPFNYEEGICLIQNQHKYPHLYGMNIKKLLAEKLQRTKADLYFKNDAACFLQGEVYAGCVSNYRKVLGITLGTGLGTAIYINGMAESADGWKYPFRESIAEEYLSTRWFTKRFEELTGKTINGVKELAGNAEEVERVKGMYAEFGYNLALFIAQFLEKEKAEAVVIGGNIVHAWPWFKAALEEHINKKFPGISIEPSRLGENATMLGAVSAWLYTAKNEGVMQK